MLRTRRVCASAAAWSRWAAHTAAKADAAAAEPARNAAALRCAAAACDARRAPSLQRGAALLFSRCLSTAAEQSLGACGIDGAYRAWANGGGWVHAYACVDPSAIVEPGAVVFPGARVGAGCRVGACSVVGPGCTLGDGTVLGYSVSVSHARVGARCTLHHGVRLGADGFGFALDVATGALTKKPQERAVVLGDDVELGANTCVDRGSWRDTRIGNGTKVDNLVQIGHNVVVGAGCLLCGHVALGGSSTLADGVVLGGKSAVRDHVSICSGVRVAAKAGVTSNIVTPGDYAGFPAMPAALWRRREAVLRRAAARRQL